MCLEFGSAANFRTGVYFGGNNNDVIDSREHCQTTLQGVFTSTPKAEILATWTAGDLTETLAGYTILMPTQTRIERFPGGLAAERFSGY
jgi:hypothetical protein